jgi:hypothetical protein
MRIVIAFVVAVSAIGCEQKPTQPEATTVAASARAAVARIVFVGKQDACECTRKRVDAGWTALQEALGTPPKLPVERLQEDTQSDEVEQYRGQQPMMALPAFYLVSADGLVVRLLQGEVTADELRAALDSN